MKSLYLKRLILGLIVLLIGCDITLLFAAQAISIEAETNTPKNKNNLPINQQQPISFSQTQQLQVLQRNQNPLSAEATNNQNLLSASQATPGMMPIQNPATMQGSAMPPATSSGNQNSAAFNSMTQTLLPMSSEQIQRLRQLFNTSQSAAAAPVGVPPRPTASSQMVNLEPGATPPVIRLAQGFVSSLVFIDSSGAPWPIEAYDIGNPSAFNIQWNRTDNTLMIQSTSLYTYGNLAVRLKGLVTPVMLTLIPGQKAVDYRVDLRVQGLGPNATSSPTGNHLPASANPELLNTLDGIPPAGSKVVKITGGNCQAWLHNDKLYLRTRHTVLSPAWRGTMSSADGMHAYEMQKTPMLLVSQDGKVVQLKVEGL